MRKSGAVTLGLLSSLLLATSCTTHHREITNQSVADDADDDPELYVGDLDVERFIYTNRVQSFADKHVLIDPNGFPLDQQFPDPSIRPVQGSYVGNIIQTAKSYMGTPYLFGSDRTEPSSFDCSDFTRWVFLYALGMDLPWDSRSQAAYVKAFSKKIYTSLEEAQPGDLLFFTSYRGNKPSDYLGLTPSEKPISHMGIYLGNGKIIHCASKKSGGVNIHPLEWRQLTTRFLFGGGILPPSPPPVM